MVNSIKVSPLLPSRLSWSNFVLDHPDGNIFHTPEIVDLFSCSKRHEPVVVSSFNEAGILTGLLVAIIHREHAGWLGSLSARSIVWGGPLIAGNDPETASRILADYDKYIRCKAIYSQFRNLFDIGHFNKIFSQFGYQFEDHLNILVDLTKPEQQLQNELNSKRRNEIRKSEKEGVTVQVISKPDEHQKAYKIIQQVYKRVKLPIPNMLFFEKAYDLLKKNRLYEEFGAYYQDELIGVMMVLRYKGCIYDWYAGSLSDYYSKNPNDLIPWKVFLWGKTEGYTRFDFGGAGKPGKPYGVRDYKLKFGGTVVNYGRFEKIHQPILMKIAKMGFQGWKLFR